MKRKLTGLLLLAAALSLLLLTGCEGNPLPAGMEEQAVLEAGRQVVEQLNGGEYQEVYDQLRSDGQETTSPEKIQTYIEDLLAKTGAYVKEKDTLVTGQKLESTGERYGTAVLYCKHEKKEVMYRVAFSTDMELMGFEAAEK